MDQVIDTNYLRTSTDPATLIRPDLKSLLESALDEDRYILTDTVVLETMKNAQWESTTRNSFAIISQFPSKIWIATEPSKLMNAELDSGKDTIDILDADLTEGFRTLLAEIASGNDGPAWDSLRNQILQAQSYLNAHQQNHLRNLGFLTSAFDAVKNDVNLAAYRTLPDKAKRQFRLRFAKTVAKMATKNSALAEGKDREIAEALSEGGGTIMRLQIGFILLGFKWTVKGTLSPNAKKATNEIMDLHHSLISTFCDGILTEESSVAEMRQDILDALDVKLIAFPNSQTSA